MIHRTVDYPMIKEMLTSDPDLFDRVTDDYVESASWTPERSLWLGWFEGDECKSLLEVVPDSMVVVSIHIYTPKKNRGKASFVMGNGLLNYLIDNLDNRVAKINAKIPVLYPDVIRFAEKNGFEKEGVDRQSHMKGGKLHDRAILGRIL